MASTRDRLPFRNAAGPGRGADVRASSGDVRAIGGNAGGAPRGQAQGSRQVGTVIGDRFLVKACLGSGRDGEHYDAVDVSLTDPRQRRRAVVLHILNARIAQQTQVLQELETSCLQPHSWAHRNVVSVLGFGRDRGEVFFATEALEGGTLRRILDEMSPVLPSEEEALSILGGVGDALQYAHAKGVVHGEIRLESIFVTTDFVVKVLDLFPASLPRMLPLFPEDTASNGVVEPDPRDDVYGLACVAYELFSGKHPFNSNSALEALTAGLTPAPIPRLSARSQEALAHGLALRREQRTATVAAFLAALGVTGHERLRLTGGAGGDGAAAAQARGATKMSPSVSAGVGSARARRDSAKTPEVGENLDLFYGSGYSEPPKKTRSRWLAWVVALGVAAGAAYFNYEWLQKRGEGLLARVDSLVESAQRARERALNVDERGASEAPAAATLAPPGRVVADPAGAGAVPDLLSDAVRSAAAPAVSGPGSRLAEPTEAARSRSALPQPTAPAARQPVPETFEPEAPVVVVSESAPSAAIRIHRRGANDTSSSLVWWTSDGTAVAGDDYADLGAKIERFAPGEETVTIYIPIVHDSKREGRENFYVNLRPGQSRERLDPAQRVEVVIEDDD